ncbi:Retrotransposon-derived protein PEG10 [Rhizoctonia solani]|uniref:Retrotransposon-derived protein PEG10 n=1 Tax=Rhizoctonia solani TaxID=456999 RepID=A0A8H8P6C6_9AGAM|nr:Retrotransposon-derived protein PEG10 [Rhizoctonia solani]QRW25147.1 Retrotransposon-derived protein PEG10 [Rhizoctonia solani]
MLNSTTVTVKEHRVADPVKTQGKHITQLLALCKETNDFVSNKDQAKPGPTAGPTTPPNQQGVQANTPRMVRPGLADPFQPIRRSRTYNSDTEDEQPRRIKKEPCTMSRGLMSLTPFAKEGWKATQWLDRMLLWVALHCHQFDKEEQMVNIIKGKGSTLKTIQALGAQFKEAFANPDAKQAAASELDWNKEAYIAQFTHGLHQIVKELLSTKDNIPKELETVFAVAIKIGNTCCENKENCPKKAETLGTSTTSTSTTTTHQVHLLEDPNYVTLEERDCQWASGLCVKCGQKSHGIKQCPYRWKATIKETTKVAEDKLGKE